MNRHDIFVRRTISHARKAGVNKQTHTAESERPDYEVAMAMQSKETLRKMSSSSQGTSGRPRTYGTRIVLDPETHDPYRHTKPDRDICPCCEELPVTAAHRHFETTVPQDILGPSKVVLREMRYRDEEAYEQYVEELQDELEGHFGFYEELLP